MKGSKTVKADSGDFKVVGPMKKVSGAENKRNAFTEDDLDAAWQYARCINPENPEILAFQLRTPEDQTVGFLGLAMSEIPDLDKRILLVSIEFVYLKPPYRRRQLSRSLLEKTLNVVIRRSEGILREYQSLKIEDHSQVRSREGLRFVERWSLVLKEFCRCNKAEFWSRTLAEADDRD